MIIGVEIRILKKEVYKEKKRGIHNIESPVLPVRRKSYTVIGFS